MKMSQTLKKIKQFASKLNKPGESTSSRPGWMVRDSHLTIGGLRMTNTTAGTFTGLILFIAFFCLPALLGTNVSATSSTITVSIESGTANPSIDIPPTAEGKFVASSATRAKVVSNHASGYIFMVTAAPLAFTDTSSVTHTISSLDAGTAINADTFSAAANTQYSNKWGYRPNVYYNEETSQTIDNTTSDTQFFFPAPLTGQILDETHTTTPAGGTTYEVAVGARIDNTADQGSYTSLFSFTAVGQVTPYSITYNKNTTDTVSSMPSPNPQTGNLDGDAEAVVTLSSSTPTRTGYTFNKWCNTTTTISGGADVCSGSSYAVSANNYPIDETSSNNNTNLYAMWNPQQYNIILTNTNATTSGSTSTKATYTQSALSPAITNPQRVYTISGLANNGSGGANATVTFPTSGVCTSTSNCKYTYAFNGWYTATSGGTQIINSSGALQPNTSYTDSNSNWTSTSGQTLYAQWGAGTAITLPTITKTGYSCGWATSSTSTTKTYSSGQTNVTLTGNTTLFGTCTPNQYTITLNQNSATTSSSPTSVSATYDSSSLSSSITNPKRSYTVSGFTAGTNASGATISSTSTLTHTYTFGGWYNTSASSGGTQIITTAGALTASNGYTNSSSQWTSTSSPTVYARWTNGSITLPTITKTGYTCGWSTSSTASSYTYASGYTGLHPTSNMVLYGICVIKSNLSLKVSFDSNVSSVAVRYGSTTGTLMGTVTTSGNSVSGLMYNANYYLIPTYKSGYEFNKWTKDSGTVGTLSSTTAANPYYRIGDGSNGVTLASKSSAVTFDQAFANAGKSKQSGYYKMQDASSSICSAVTQGQTGRLIDTRDSNVYYVGKLKDNKCWMLENLNLAGGTALSANNTNVTSAYISSFTTSNNLTKSGNTIVLPASSTSGFSSNNYSYVYNSGNKTNCGASGQNTPCYSYYSWDAATLGSGRSISTDNTDAQQSICPKNWRLPTSRTTSATNWQTTSDFYAMAHQYGLDSTTSTSEYDADFYNNAGPGTTPNFLLAGRYYRGSFGSGGSSGLYWSSTSFSNINSVRCFTFSSAYVSSDGYTTRSYGYPVRCLFSS